MRPHIIPGGGPYIPMGWGAGSIRPIISRAPSTIGERGFCNKPIHSVNWVWELTEEEHAGNGVVVEALPEQGAEVPVPRHHVFVQSLERHCHF